MTKINAGRPGSMEHKREKVASISVFIVRLLRYAVIAFLLIAVSAAIGTVGYQQLANLSWIDSFYMACMILTGMGPTVDMDSSAAKMFSSFYALYSGVVFLGVTAILFAPVIHRLLHILHVEDDKEG